MPEDHSIHNEPHLKKDRFEPDPSEGSADTPEAFQKLSVHEKLDQSVVHEPSYSAELSGMSQESFPTWKDYFAFKSSRVTFLDSWAVTILAALVAGPLAIITAIWGTGISSLAILTLVVFAPVTEEMAKVLVCLLIVERRPWLFQNGFQVLLCCFAGGLAFGVIENLIYASRLQGLENYESIMQFRWVATTLLHVVCSTLAGFGVLRIWRDCMVNGVKPRLKLGRPIIIAAMVIHGTYNGVAVLMQVFGFFG